MKRTHAHARITRNIRDYGYHVYVVSGGPTPRWAYTIGLSPRIGYELVFAGGATYPKSAVLEILRNWASMLGSQKSLLSNNSAEFQLGPVCAQWATQLLVGAHDFYQSTVNALQILPDRLHRTIDVPDLSVSLESSQVTPWCWLEKPWPYKISEKAEAMADVHVLMGRRVKEVARWEEGYWEAFSDSGDDVRSENACLAPLGTLIGADPSLEPITALAIGAGMWRVENGMWHSWHQT